MTRDEEEWGEERMIACAQQLLAQPGGVTARQLLNCILETADKFTCGAPQHDDMTLLVCAISNPASLEYKNV
jgi:sigma-B regulation protein RsbU (phosphoserine phosphatase)